MVGFVKWRGLVALLALAAVAVAPGDGHASAPSRHQALLAEPPLVDPTTVVVDRQHTKLHLDVTKDYVVQVADAPLGRSVTIEGGHNVVLRKGTLRYARPSGSKASWRCRGLELKGQSGTMWVSGLSIRGPLLEGIDLDQRLPGARVVLQDITIDPVHGTQSGHHADLLQTWAGPDTLVVDGFRGTSDFQGIFLKPNDSFDGPPPSLISLKDVDLDVSHGRYALWVNTGHPYPVTVTSVTVKYNRARPSRNLWLWPKPSTGDHTWDAVVAR